MYLECNKEQDMINLKSLVHQEPILSNFVFTRFRIPAFNLDSFYHIKKCVQYSTAKLSDLKKGKFMH